MAKRRVTPNDSESTLKRRDFLKVAGIGAGALITGEAAAKEPSTVRGSFASVTPPSSHVVVIGAGAFGGWTAYWLRKQGVAVTLVDAYGPGNSRATSGDESRGVRSSYGDKAPPIGELWTKWARLAMQRWPAFDREWGHDLKSQMFWRTDDLYMRPDWDAAMKRTREIWEKQKVPFEVLTPDECRYRWPQINIEDIGAIMLEHGAGVVRARRGAQAVASVLTHNMGVKLIISRAKPGPIVNGKMTEVTLLNGDKLHADAFVFACGPWLGKVFPELLGNRIRTPLGQVVYYGTPTGSNRFTYPSMPSFNFPGVTGWVALPEDSRGFRVRGTEGGAGGRGAAPGGAAGAPGGGRGAADSTASRGAAPGGAGAAVVPTPPPAAAPGRGDGRGAPAAAPGAGGAAAPGAGGAANQGGRGGANATPPDPRQGDPDLSTRWFDIATQARQRDFVAHRFPDMKDAPVNETRCCHYENTVSRNFIIDLLPGATNAWVAGGGNSEAYKSGPVIGEYVMQRVLRHHTDPEIDKQFVIPKDEFTAADANGRGGRGAAAADSTAGRGAGRGAAPDSGRGGRGRGGGGGG